MAARALGKMAASLAAATARASAAGLRTPSVLLLNRQRVCGLAATAHRPLGNSAFHPLQLRSFSASAVASATDITAIVSDELKYEQESYTKPALTPPAGWEITEKAGSSKVSLTRDYGEEVVQVDFTAREYNTEAYGEDEEEDADEDALEDEDEEPLPDSMTLEVCVVKEGSDDALIFEVETDGDSIDILDVSLDKMRDEDSTEKEEEEDEDEEIYGGPVFSELDQKLQQAFTDYLEERGVNGELGRFVMDFSEDKEQREYMHWLQGVQKFLKQ
ncbi:g2751 [Coccomyxa viridis]|uniref:G2751 protein n=1 Tax=Coccomyxa viridis TaxID=1274662 RepID=A0ABP1FT43_9CHLO